MSEEAPEVQELFDLIRECLPRAVEMQGAAYRSVGAKYATEPDLLSGDGAAYYGGRWNPPGIRAIYASLDIMTATKEAYREFSDYGFKPPFIRPRTLVGIEVKLRSLLDLNDRGIRQRLGFLRATLVQEDWRGIQDNGEESWTQAIGRGCSVAGFEGLLVPSARNSRGRNIVLFPTNIAFGSLKIMAKKDLPAHPD